MRAEREENGEKKMEFNSAKFRSRNIAHGKSVFYAKATAINTGLLNKTKWLLCRALTC
jgi:hypothetical protein